MHRFPFPFLNVNKSEGTNCTRKGHSYCNGNLVVAYENATFLQLWLPETLICGFQELIEIYVPEGANCDNLKLNLSQGPSIKLVNWPSSLMK